MWTDEIHIHEAATPSLKKNVEHILIDQYDHLPLLKPGRQKVYCDTEEAINQRCEELLSVIASSPAGTKTVLSTDIEWFVEKGEDGKPRAKVGQSHVDALAIGTWKGITIFKLTQFNGKSLPARLEELLQSPRVVFVGLGISGDLKRMITQWKLSKLASNTKNKTAFLDLGEEAMRKGLIKKASISLATLVAFLLRKRLVKDDSLRFGPWDADTLSQALIEYLACDIEAGLLLWRILSKAMNVGLPVPVPIPELLVDIRSGKTVIARGILAKKQPNSVRLETPDGKRTPAIDLYRTRALVEITDVILPGHKLPFLPSSTFADYQKANKLPFQTVVNLSTLTTRAAQPPLALTDAHIDSSKAAEDPMTSIPSAPMDILGPGVDVAASTSMLDLLASACEEAGEAGLLDELDDDQSLDEEGEKTPDEEASEPPATFTPSQFVVQPSEQSTVGTHVREDNFHEYDGILKLLPKKHSAFKPAARDISLILCAPDAGDVERANRVLAEYGTSYEQMCAAGLRGKFQNSVRVYALPAEEQAARADIWFNAYKDVVCSKDKKNGILFKKTEARDRFASFKNKILKGFLQDPPGVSMYYLMGKGSDGLYRYRCIRSTSGLEGYHKELKRTTSPAGASPALTASLMTNSRHRHNIIVSQLASHSWLSSCKAGWYEEHDWESLSRAL